MIRKSGEHLRTLIGNRQSPIGNHRPFWLRLCRVVVLGFYLIHALRRILHTHCPLCYAAHATNIILFVLLIFVS